MFDNIGSKIMKLAKVLCWIGIIASIVSGIVIISGGSRSYNSGSSVFSGILTIVLGCLFPGLVLSLLWIWSSDRKYRQYPL